MEMESQFTQLKEFTRHIRVDVRCETAKILSSLAGDTQSHPYFSKLNLGEDLLHLSFDTKAETARHAMSCLVNLSANPNFAANFLKMNPFDRIVKQFKSKEIFHHDLLCKLLLNLTREKLGRAQLIQKNAVLEGLNVIRLMHAISTSVMSGGDGGSDLHSMRKFAYLPYVICNVAREADGRNLLTRADRNLLKYMIPYMGYNVDFSEVEAISRRVSGQVENDNGVGQAETYSSCCRTFLHGVWDTVRNCCFVLDDAPGDRQADAIELFQRNDNELLYEILNPILAGSFSYRKTVRESLPARLVTSYMDVGKQRFDDEYIRRASLDCMYCIVGSGTTGHSRERVRYIRDFVVNELCLGKVMKEYEQWEDESELVECSKKLQKAIKFVKKITDDEIEKMPSVEDRLGADQSSGRDSEEEEKDIGFVTMETVEKESSTAVDSVEAAGDAKVEEDSGMATAPVEMRSKSGRVEGNSNMHRYDAEQSGELVDWILRTTNGVD